MVVFKGVLGLVIAEALGEHIVCQLDEVVVEFYAGLLFDNIEADFQAFHAEGEDLEPLKEFKAVHLRRSARFHRLKFQKETPEGL